MAESITDTEMYEIRLNSLYIKFIFEKCWQE